MAKNCSPDTNGTSNGQDPMSEIENNRNPLSDQELQDKIKNETAPLPWQDLQIAFARGIVILVSQPLDLADVAYQVSKNNTDQVNRWMEEGKLSHVRDDQALEWFNNQSELLTTIVKPWVLIQELK